MIARELLVKLGFDIDEGKFKRFTHNVEALKSNMSGLKSKIGLKVDDGKLTNISQTIVAAKAKMIDLRQQINQRMYPKIDTKSLALYRQELAALSEEQRQKVLALNKIERDAVNEQLKLLKDKSEQQGTVTVNLDKTNEKLEKARDLAKNSSMAFSRFFAKFALIGAGSGLLALRNTLKDAKDFKEGRGKTNNSFSRKQINDVDRFNVSLKQLKKTLGELRNKFVIDLLPTFRENLDALNEWLLKNKVLINSKVKKFIETLGTAFKILASSLRVVFSALNPLVDLIGGWGTLLSGIIGVGILSWLVRLGLFLSAGATAIKVFVGAVRVLTAALLTNPIALTIMAIVAALVLVADEFIVTAKGGDSLMNRFAGLKKMGDSFIETLKETWQWLVKVKDNMVDFTLGGVGKVKDFFTGGGNQDSGSLNSKESGEFITQSKYPHKFPLSTTNHRIQKPHEMLQNAIAPNSTKSGGLNIVYAKDHFKFPQSSLTNYHNSRSENNNVKTVNSNNKNTFNVSINVPKGTSEEQSRAIAMEVQKQVQAEMEFHNEKTLNAIGAI
jgi:hypothetical protein